MMVIEYSILIIASVVMIQLAARTYKQLAIGISCDALAWALILWGVW